MPTPKFICGAECGLAGAGAAGPGVEHWSSINGSSPTINTSIYRSDGHGVRSFRFNPPSTSSYLTHTFDTAIASPATMIARIYVYFTTLPSSDTRIFSSNACSIVFKTSDSTLRAGGSTTTDVASSGAVITTGVWYCLDIRLTRDTNKIVDLSVDDVAQTQYSISATAQTMTNFNVGIIDTCTATMYVDDICVSGTLADFPIGEGTVVGLYPNGDGTHVYNSSTDFTKAGSANTALATPSSNETTSWQSLPKPLSFTVDTAKYIRALTTSNTEYLRWAFENLPAVNISAINGVMFTYLAQGAGGSSSAADLLLRLNNGGNLANIGSNNTIGNSSLASFIKTFELAPPGTSWTETIINDISVEVVGGTDKSPIPELHGVCIEVDFVESTTLPGSISPAIFTLTPQALTGLAGILISPVVLTLTPIALSILAGDVSTSISPVIFTLSPAVIRGPDPNPISRFPKTIAIVQS